MKMSRAEKRVVEASKWFTCEDVIALSICAYGDAVRGLHPPAGELQIDVETGLSWATPSGFVDGFVDALQARLLERWVQVFRSFDDLPDLLSLACGPNRAHEIALRVGVALPEFYASQRDSLQASSDDALRDGSEVAA